jgi:hypothetical protein
MQRDVERRPESADAVRLALGEFLRHRGGAALAARAAERHAALDRALAAEPRDEEAIQRLSGEVTFGYRAALAAWAESATARDGFARATRSLIRHDLAQGMAMAARARLADLDPPDDALRAEIERAIERADEQGRRDAALRRELDPRTGRRGRVRLTLILGMLWTVQPLAQQMGWLGTGAETNLGGALMGAASVGFWAIFAFAARRSILRSRLNRQLASVALIVLVVQVVAYAGAALLGLSARTTQTILLFVWFAITSVLGATLDARLLVAAGGFLSAFFVAAEEPRLRLFAESGANLVLVATAVVAWRRRPDADEAS